MLNIFFLGNSLHIADNIEISNILNHSKFIFSFTKHDSYTILRVLGSNRKDLQFILRELYILIKANPLIGFNALERKM